MNSNEEAKSGSEVVQAKWTTMDLKTYVETVCYSSVITWVVPSKLGINQTFQNPLIKGSHKGSSKVPARDL